MKNSGKPISGSADDGIASICCIQGFRYLDGVHTAFSLKITDVSENTLIWESNQYFGSGFLVEVRNEGACFNVSVKECSRISEHPSTFRCQAELVEPNADLSEIFKEQMLRNQLGIIENSQTRLLVVDDEPNLVEVISSYFRNAGFEVKAVESGKAAMEVLATHRFDIVLCDIMMPNMSGDKFFALAKEQIKPCPHFFFMTGFAIYSNTQAFEEGAAGHFSKPLDLSLMVDVIKRKVAEDRQCEKTPIPESSQSASFYVGRDGVCLVINRANGDTVQLLHAV